jgi:hypothetical protein
MSKKRKLYVFNPPRRSALPRILDMSVKTFRCMHDECREDCSTNFRLKTLLNCCVKHASVDADYEFCIIFSCQFGNKAWTKLNMQGSSKPKRRAARRRKNSDAAAAEVSAAARRRRRLPWGGAPPPHVTDRLRPLNSLLLS